MPRVAPPQLHKGAETCDLVPAWRDGGELRAMLEGVYAADPEDLTPQLALADMLAERCDPREAWVRVGVRLWAESGSLELGAQDWDYERAKAALEPVCNTVVGWRVAGLWGCLVAWHAPSGDGSARKMGRTWVDERVRVIQRCLWFWALGFLETNPLDAAAWRQAYAAGSQADVAWSQADAAGRQADAAWSQAYAAGRQADAAWRQADAAWSQAYAAWRQADVAWRQADAAWSQAYAAGRQAAVWKFARACWSLCESAIPELEVA